MSWACKVFETSRHVGLGSNALSAPAPNATSRAFFPALPVVRAILPCPPVEGRSASRRTRLLPTCEEYKHASSEVSKICRANRHGLLQKHRMMAPDLADLLRSTVAEKRLQLLSDLGVRGGRHTVSSESVLSNGVLVKASGVIVFA